MELFSPITIKNLTLKNRLVMPPLVVLGNADADGNVTERCVRHYEDRARNGVGLIIVEATCIDRDGRLIAPQLGVWDDSFIDGLAKIPSACKKYGAGILLQLQHAGEKTPDAVSVEKISSSGDGEHIHTLTLEQIKEIQEKFLSAALRAKAAGYDGIELHGAHSYLLSQFFSPLRNVREDQYGGSAENRARIAVEIIQKIREKVGDSFIISVRMGGNEPDFESAEILAKEFEKAGADLLHVSFGYRPPKKAEFAIPEDFPFNAIVYNGLQIKKSVNIPVIVVNGINTPEDALLLAKNYDFDFVAVGRGHLVNPDWVSKLSEGKTTTKCVRCRGGCGFLLGRPCPAAQESC